MYRKTDEINFMTKRWLSMRICCVVYLVPISEMTNVLLHFGSFLTCFGKRGFDRSRRQGYLYHDLEQKFFGT